MSTTSPIDELVEAVRASLQAPRAELARRVAEIESALRAYERAVEQEVAERFAAEHALKRPAKTASSHDAARALAALVARLPELKAAAPPPAQAEPEAEPSAASEPPQRVAQTLGKLAIVGALAGREKYGALPPQLSEHSEWVDTERHGVHAIGNLPQRIRQGRVSGVIILDRAVQHKHTEPVVAAARDMQVPVVFAGQGGKASLLRALAQLEKLLA